MFSEHKQIKPLWTTYQQHLSRLFITKTCLYNFDPLKPHFYIVKLGFIGVYIIFLISAQKHILWVLVRTASARVLVRTASLKRFQRVPTIYVLSRNMKNIRDFYLKIFSFLEVKFSIYLNRRVFVMFGLSCCLCKGHGYTGKGVNSVKTCYAFLKRGLPLPLPCWINWLLIPSQIRLLDPGCWYEPTYLMTKSSDPDQLASSEANWCGSTLFAKAGHCPGSAGQGLNGKNMFPFEESNFL